MRLASPSRARAENLDLASGNDPGQDGVDACPVVIRERDHVPEARVFNRSSRMLASSRNPGNTSKTSFALLSS